jgi:uncharacterized protein YidB (DUF937 family)
MGLLDDLLAGLGSQGSAAQSMGQPTQRSQAQSGDGGMGQLMTALLPVVLAMVANRSSAPSGQGQSAGSQGGGLGGLLSAVFGGGGGAASMGGLGALLTQLQQAGLGEQAQSWVGRGQNLPVPADAMEKVFGRSGLAEIARQAGVSEADATRGLSQLLPAVVDHVTPDGQVPNFDALTASVDALTQRYQRR